MEDILPNKQKRIILLIVFYIFTLGDVTANEISVCYNEKLIDLYIQSRNISVFDPCWVNASNKQNVAFQTNKIAYKTEIEVGNKYFYFSFPMIHNIRFFHSLNKKILSEYSYSKIDNKGSEFVLIPLEQNKKNTIVSIVDSRNSIQHPYILFKTQISKDIYLNTNLLLNGLWFGIFSLASLIVILVYYKNRSILARSYLIHVLSLFVIQLAFSGYLFSYFSFLPAFIKDRAVVMCCGLLVYGTVSYVAEMFRDSTKLKRILGLYKTISYVGLGHFILTLFVYNQVIIKLTSYVILLLSVSTLLISIFAVTMKVNKSKPLFCAFIIFLTSSLASTLKDLGVLMLDDIFVNHLVKMGLIVEILILGIILINKIIYDKTTLITLKNSRILYDKSRQIAHDIRSPLEALKSVATSLEHLDFGTKIIITNSIGRISDIANNLLKNENVKGENNSIENFRILLDELINDKKFEHNINVHYKPSLSYTSAFILGKKNDLYRSLSNLINNSVEAQEKDLVKIDVSLIELENEIELVVKDYGKGMSKELLTKVLKG